MLESLQYGLLLSTDYRPRKCKGLVYLLIPLALCSCDTNSGEESKKEIVLARASGTHVAERPLPVFAEVIYQFDVRSLQDRSLPHSSPLDSLNGYHLIQQQFGTPPTLYPAQGAPISLNENACGFVGQQLHFHHEHMSAPHQRLKELPIQGFQWQTSGEPNFQTTMAFFDIFAALRPAIEVELNVNQENQLVVNVSGEQAILKAGESKSFSQHEKKIKREILAAEFVGALDTAGFKQVPVEKDVLRELSGEFPSNQPISLYGRVTVAFHGAVRLGAFDVLEQWNTSNQKALAGPYDEALVATKNVLLKGGDSEAEDPVENGGVGSSTQEPATGTDEEPPNDPPPTSASAFDPNSQKTTTSVRNPDGSRSVTVTDQAGNVVSTHTEPPADQLLPSASISDPETGNTTTSQRNADGSTTITRTDRSGNILSIETIK